MGPHRGGEQESELTRRGYPAGARDATVAAVATVDYKGPDLKFVRTITKGGGWVDDPDWLGDFTIADPEAQAVNVPTILSGSGAPMRNLAWYLSAVDANGVQVAATATLRGIVIHKAQLFTIKGAVKGRRFASSDAIAAWDFLDPFIVPVSKHLAVLRVSSIVSASATHIHIGVQEI